MQLFIAYIIFPQSTQPLAGVERSRAAARRSRDPAIGVKTWKKFGNIIKLYL